jgi:hypothetical protein
MTTHTYLKTLSSLGNVLICFTYKSKYNSCTLFMKYFLQGIVMTTNSYLKTLTWKFECLLFCVKILIFHFSASEKYFKVLIFFI